MNDLLKKFAEQAKKYALDAMIKITDKEQALKVYSESYDTKFAELIVRECANIDFRREVGLTADDDYEISKVIKVHFGVEE